MGDSQCFGFVKDAILPNRSTSYSSAHSFITFSSHMWLPACYRRIVSVLFRQNYFDQLRMCVWAFFGFVCVCVSGQCERKWTIQVECYIMGVEGGGGGVVLLLFQLRARCAAFRDSLPLWYLTHGVDRTHKWPNKKKSVAYFHHSRHFSMKGRPGGEQWSCTSDHSRVKRITCSPISSTGEFTCWCCFRCW